MVPHEGEEGWDVWLVHLEAADATPFKEKGATVLSVDWVVVVTGKESGPPVTPPSLADAARICGRQLTDHTTRGMETEELLAAVGVAARAADTLCKEDAVPPFSYSAAPEERSVIIDGFGKTALDLAMTLSDEPCVSVPLVSTLRHWRMQFWEPSRPASSCMPARLGAPCPPGRPRPPLPGR